MCDFNHEAGRIARDAIIDDLIAERNAARAERDKYKPFHDAVIDMAVSDWTYEWRDERDYQYAIKKLIVNYIAQSTDPQISEAFAKITAEKDDLEAECLHQANVILKLMDRIDDLKAGCNVPTQEEAKAMWKNLWPQADGYSKWKDWIISRLPN